MQKFAAREPFVFANGATGWRPGGPMDCIGPFARVNECPIRGMNIRRTCYATGYPDTFFSVPAATRFRGRYIGGYLALDGGNVEFVPYDRFRERLGIDASESNS